MTVCNVKVFAHSDEPTVSYQLTAVLLSYGAV